MVTAGCAGLSNVVRQCSTFKEQIYKPPDVKSSVVRQASAVCCTRLSVRCDQVVGMVGAGAKLSDSKGVEWFGF